MSERNLPAGIDSLRKAYDASQGDMAVGMQYALAVKMNKEPSKACAIYKEMLTTRGDVPQLQIALAAQDVAIQRYDEAVPVLQSLMARFPQGAALQDKGVLLMMLGTCYLYQGEHTAAVQQLESAIACFPNSAVILDLLGQAHLKAGQLEKADAALDQALGINSKIPSALFYRGICFERKGLAEQATRAFQDSYKFGKERWERGTDNGGDYFLMSLICSHLGLKDEAEVYKKQAAELLFTYEAP